MKFESLTFKNFSDKIFSAWYYYTAATNTAKKYQKVWWKPAALRSHDETLCCFAFLGLEQLLNHSFILSAPQLYAKEKLEMQMLAPRHSSIL
jgi:hypothetical protein